MKIAIVGATGFIGSKLRDEAVSRGHVVTAITRSPEKLPRSESIIPAPADVNDVPTLTGYITSAGSGIHADEELGRPVRSGPVRQLQTGAADAGATGRNHGSPRSGVASHHL
jgi:NAD(P)H-binding